MQDLLDIVEILKPSTYPGIMKDRYLVGTMGNIYDTNLNRFKELNPHKRTGYIMGKFKMNDLSTKTISTHRLVAFEHVDGYSEDDGKVFVDHNDFIKYNNYYENLEWVTQSENNKRRFLNPENNFTNPPTYYGVDHPSTKTDIKLVETICELLQNNKSMLEILKYFGHNNITDNPKLYYLISDIKYKKRWTTVSDKYF